MEQIYPNQIQPDDIILEPLTDSVYVAQEITTYHQEPELYFVQPRSTCGVKPICLKYWDDSTLIRIGNLRTLQTEQIGLEVSQMYKSILQKCEEINNKLDKISESKHK